MQAACLSAASQAEKKRADTDCEDDRLRGSEIDLLELLPIVALPASQLCCEPQREATAEYQPRPALSRHNVKIVSVRSWTLTLTSGMKTFSEAPVPATCKKVADIKVHIPF